MMNKPDFEPDALTELDQAKREKVFLAAKELFGRFGFKKTTVDEIADLAGISKRTIYEVFHSKEAILADLVMFEALSFRRSCMGQIKHISDPVEKLRVFCRLSSDYFADNLFLGQVLADDQGLFAPFLTNEHYLVETGIKEIISRLLVDGLQQGVFHPMDLSSTVECIMVLFRGFSYKPPARPADRYAWIPFVLNAILAHQPDIQERG
jgi:AcrR family transcriptional regulator